MSIDFESLIPNIVCKVKRSISFQSPCNQLKEKHKYNFAFDKDIVDNETFEIECLCDNL